MTRTILELLDELRAIAQLGLHYAKNEYDLERYRRLMQLAAEHYADITGLDEPEIIARFNKELGYVTPKVGVSGVVFSEDHKILLARRSDDGTWGLPAGWCEVGEEPAFTMKREMREETGLEVEVTALIDTFTRSPSMFNEPHASCLFLYHCHVLGGTLTPSHETPELGFFDYTTIDHWHKDHRRRVVRAYEWLGQQRHGN